MRLWYALILVFIYLLPFSKEEYLYHTKFIDMNIDHFSFTTDYKFKLRYIINDTYWKPKELAPIFLYAGNEDNITIFADNSGYIWETAPEFNALILFVEHRYYGQSIPFHNFSLKDPKKAGFLTVSQAMMDFVKVIYHIKSVYNITSEKLPVIAFGGSYGGMLAAWLRMKYPSVITGALASSAPIWLFNEMTDCNMFDKQLTNIYKQQSKMCESNVKQSWFAINKIGKTERGKEWLSKTFRTCKAIHNKQDIFKLKGFLTELYVNLAMVNYPYPTNFTAPLPANPLSNFCNLLTLKHRNEEELLMQLYKSISIYTNSSGQVQCIDINGELIGSTETWNYQKCNEVIMPICSDGSLDMFDRGPWDFKKFSKDCYDRFKVKSSLNKIRDLFGGKNINWLTNVIFSNGLIDPWGTGGVWHNLSKSAIAVILPGAHHLDLRAANKADPIAIREARIYYKYLFNQWINEQRS